MKFFRETYLNGRLFVMAGLLIGLFIFAYLFPLFSTFAKLASGLLLVCLCLDLWMLFRISDGLRVRREVPEKFSNGDPNPVKLAVQNQYPYPMEVEVIDELPFQFQQRNFSLKAMIPARDSRTWEYTLRPVKRGEYHFGAVNVFAMGPLGLLQRRYRIDTPQMVPAYPSFIQMRKYQLMAISNRLTEIGVKKIRRLGHTTEFEQIKEYVRGDDYRTVNWKATARTGKLMVNQYMDERAQNVFCLIDKSRLMQLPFAGMTLLDYAINATLVISNIAIYRQDKAGLISFAEKIGNYIPASNRPTHMQRIMEALYNEETHFLEADYERLYALVKRRIGHRSLLLLFTHFESLSGMHRQLPFLQHLSRHHLLVVIFFVNTELKALLESQPATTEDVYIKTIGEHFTFEKEQIVRELERHGILCVLTPPEQLTVNTLNTYLELKARGLI